ncbi:MAG: T9SS type A sorting domain-containing protein, partial [Cyclobacteriaceae bacterium]|nr:T9SS type A sorting domain-containing protein [Cyclobacteriaceae bacterium]
HWIVQGLIPPINIDLSELNMNLPSFYIPGLITRLNSAKVTSVEEELYIPDEIILSQNYPNPFNPSTTIKFSLPSPGFATLKIYNTLGEEVAVLLNNELSTGTYEVEWNANGLPSGVYFYHLQTDGFVETKKMLLLK